MYYFKCLLHHNQYTVNYNLFNPFYILYNVVCHQHPSSRSLLCWAWRKIKNSESRQQDELPNSTSYWQAIYPVSMSPNMVQAPWKQTSWHWGQHQSPTKSTRQRILHRKLVTPARRILRGTWTQSLYWQPWTSMWLSGCWNQIFLATNRCLLQDII